MSELDSAEVRAFGDGAVYKNAVGADFPDDIETPISRDDGWINLGYLTEEGPRASFGREKKDIPAWQSFDPVRSIVTGIPKSLKFDLLQSNAHTFTLAMGGGEIVEVSDGVFQYEPPDEASSDEHAIIYEVIDGDIVYRFCFRRCEINNAVEIAFVRTDATKYAVEMKILAAPDGAKPFFILTNDPNFEYAEAGS